MRRLLQRLMLLVGCSAIAIVQVYAQFPSPSGLPSLSTKSCWKNDGSRNGPKIRRSSCDVTVPP